jgi:hypothetical protein
MAENLEGEMSALAHLLCGADNGTFVSFLVENLAD